MRGAAGAFALPYVVPGSVFGQNAPSERVVMGIIGAGGMGTNDMMAFLANADVQVVAVCDPETGSDGYGHWYNKGGVVGAGAGD